MEICPLAAAWGSWADWAAVVVGLGAAIATTVVAVLAHKTSKRAAEIAEEAKFIAQQQHKEAVTHREETARVLGRLLLGEVGSLPGRLDMILRLLTGSLNPVGELGVRDYSKFKASLSEAQAPLMPASLAAQERIHNLPNVLGADLATMLGNCQALNTIASRVEARSAVAFAPPSHGGARFKYDGNQGDLVALVQQIAEMTVAAVELATDFRGFVGVREGEYLKIEAYARSALESWTEADQP